MRLWQFIETYEAERTGEDFITISYRTETKGRYTTNRISYGDLKQWQKSDKEALRERAALLLQSDIMETHIYETEGEHWGASRFTCRQYSARIDEDQAMIALGIHPAMRRKKPTDNL